MASTTLKRAFWVASLGSAVVSVIILVSQMESDGTNSTGYSNRSLDSRSDSSRTITINEAGKDTYAFEFSLKGRVFSKPFQNVSCNVTTSFIYSFSAEVTKKVGKMIPFEENESDRIFATAPAFTWFKGQFYAVIRARMLAELEADVLNDTKHLNKFQHNFLYAQTFDQFMKSRARGRLLGIPVPIEIDDLRTGPVDPRLVTIGDRVLLTFYMRSKSPVYPKVLNAYILDMSTNELFRPKVDGENQTKREKNWAPFDIGGHLHFVYTFDPLRILKCEKLIDCKFIYVDKSVNANDKVFDPLSDCLRGGTQFDHYRGPYYISVAHSRLKGRSYAHIVLMRTDEWRIVYVSDVIQMGPRFLKTVNYVVPWMSGPFLFPVGLNVEPGGDVIDIATNVADAQSHLMRVTGIKRILDSAIRIDRIDSFARKNILQFAPRQVQKFVIQSAERFSGVPQELFPGNLEPIRRVPIKERRVMNPRHPMGRRTTSLSGAALPSQKQEKSI